MPPAWQHEPEPESDFTLCEGVPPGAETNVTVVIPPLGNARALRLAVERGDLEGVRREIASGANVNCSRARRSVINDESHSVRGDYAGTDAPSGDGVSSESGDKTWLSLWTPSTWCLSLWTPLHRAASKGHASITQALLEAQADPTLRTALPPHGAWVTALQLACAAGSIDCVLMLIRHERTSLTDL